jgi:hypothetical protein
MFVLDAGYGAGGMQTMQQVNNCAADHYWLAFLLTSVDVVLEGLDFGADANSSSSTGMLARSRRVLVEKALVAIRDELAESARRTASTRAKKATLPPRSWALNPDVTKSQLERARLVNLVVVHSVSGPSQHFRPVCLHISPVRACETLASHNQRSTRQI